MITKKSSENVTLSLRLSGESYKILRTRCNADISVQDLMRLAIDEYAQRIAQEAKCPQS